MSTLPTIASAGARKRGGRSSPARLCWLLFVCLAVFAPEVPAAEVLPPKPSKFFNDSAAVVASAVAAQLNEQLAQYERESSNQLLVAIYPKMRTDSSIEDFAPRIYQSWGVGTKERDNGAVLFVFVQDRKMWITTGYGLEASLTDAECRRIVEEMKPFFRSADYAGGLSHAVSAMIEATKGEYQGTGRTLSETRQGKHDKLIFWLVVAYFVAVVAMNIYGTLRRIRRGYMYRSSGRYRLPGDSSWWNSGGGWSSSGGGWGGGGSSWSGGGGSTGGGGAGGSW